MTTEITVAAQDRHEQDLGQLTHSRLWPQDGKRDLAAIEMAVVNLTRPVSTTWLMARVASLLSPYYEKDVPQSVREMEAEDWAVALEGYPQWAIEKAVRWWKGGDNPKRSRRPLEGDIAEKCYELMDGVRAGQRILESGQEQVVFRASNSQPIERCTPEAAAEIMAHAGFAPKRMPE